MKTFTVWCQDIDGRGTIWIDTVEADTPDEAAELGRANCGSDWQYHDDDNIHVLGVAEGEVKILFWEDIDAD